MTEAPVRPTPPRRAITLLPSLLVVIAGFAVGALLQAPLVGAIWGIVAAAGAIVSLRVAGLTVTPVDMAALGAGIVSSAILTSAYLAQPKALTPSMAVTLGAIWLLAGAGAAYVVARRGIVTAGINVALLWVGAGILAAPLASSFGAYPPGALVETPFFIVLSLVVALVGGGGLLSGISAVRGIGIVGLLLTITFFAGSRVGFDLIGLFERFGNVANIPNFWPPDFGWAIGGGTWWWVPSWDFGAPNLPSPLIETFRIAILASVTGCLVALPIAFMASTITAPGRLSYLLDKGFMNLIRTIPDLFWALLFVAAVSTGPLAGVLALFFFSLAIMAKLLSETIDTVDTGPLEAARATGGSHFPAVRVSVFPQVLPNYVAYGLYIFEINIRASVVIGLVGAGGIGRVLEAQRSFFQFDRVLAIVIVIFVLVFVIEQISVAFRRRLV